MRDDAGRRMDQMYRFQRHIYDVTRKPYLLGRTTLINGLVPPECGSVLEIGCGTGWNLIQVATAYPKVALYGFDVSYQRPKLIGQVTAGALVIAPRIDSTRDGSVGDRHAEAHSDLL